MKPSIPSGTRDFSPVEMQKRNYIFGVIKKYFHLYGFEQIETPAVENLSTLTGKYGEEGDQLLFKILNSRINESKKKDELRREFELSLEKSWNTDLLTERALRYDLTVPFARYVVMHQNDISFPFKRYQIQPVWRADRPQKGRYREFFQCDADMIGSNSLLNEVDLIQLMADVYIELKIPVTIKINNRKILSGIAESIGAPDRMIDIAVAIDKLDKVGQLGVDKELREKGFTEEQILALTDIILMQNNAIVYGDNAQKENKNKTKLNFLKNGSNYRNSEVFRKGIEELEFIFETVNQLWNFERLSVNLDLDLDITLARGLNYYTGAIFEVKANVSSLSSSITGGGRYDDLTGIFGLKNMSGVGISFGIDRIFDVMNDANLFPDSISKRSTVDLLFVNFGEAEQSYLLKYVKELRVLGIRTELYPDFNKKLQKQFEYADKKQIPFVCIVGGDEMSRQIFKLKDMQKGEQTEVNFDQLVAAIKNF
jgi:histidyl-tRNA synthetase